MSRLKMHFLGEPQVRHGDEPVQFRTRNALALLAYLALESGLHGREALAALLWPRVDHETGRARLRTTLYYLRQAIRHPEGATDIAHLQVEGSRLGFERVSDYSLDVELLQGIGPDSDLADLKRSVDGYRGDFLAGFTIGDSPEFERWAAERRERYHIQAKGAFDRLSAELGARGEFEAGLQVAQRWTHLDSWDERAYRRLIELQLQAGDRSAARLAYERCRRTLSEGLGAELSAETEALAARIDAATSSERAVVKRRRPPTQELPFVGRAAEQRRLGQELARARDAGPRLVALLGEAGIGKSRLAAEWLNWARSQGARCLRGRAFEAGSRLPYQPWVEALRPIIDEIQLRGQVDPVWLAELSRLFPELEIQTPELSQADTAPQAPGRLYEGIVQVGSRLAEERPLVMCLDDMQWADAATLDVLEYALPRWRDKRAPLLLLLLARGGSYVASDEGGAWLERLGRETPLTRLELGPLSEAETVEWVARLWRSASAEPAPGRSSAAGEGGSAQPPPAASREERLWQRFGKRLFAETGGQPFYVSETIKALLDQGALRWQEAGQGRWRVEFSPRLEAEQRLGSLAQVVKPGLRQVVERRLTGLTSAMFELVAAAAVLGRSCEIGELCAVAGVEAEQALLPLDQIVEARLLKQAPDPVENPGQYLFEHDHTRQVAYELAGPARRNLYHRRAYETLQARAASPGELAHHACRGGLLESCVRESLQAGQRALELFAARDAARYLEQARAVIDDEPGVIEAIGRGAWRQVYEQLGRAYEVVNEWDSARDVYQELLERAREMEEPVAEVRALLRQAALAVQSEFDVDRAAEILAEARAVAERHDDAAALAEAEWRLATVRYFQMKRRASLEHAERALKLAREAGDRELIAGSLNALGYARQGIGAWGEVEAPLQEAIELYAELGNRALQVDCQLMAATGRLHSGRVSGALELVGEAERLLAGADNPWGKVNAGWVRVLALHERGSYEQALRDADETLAIASQHDLTPMVVSVLAARGAVWRDIGDPQGAIDDHRRASEALQRIPNPHFPPLLAPHLCIDFALADEWERAGEQARIAVSDPDWAWLHSATWLCSGFRHWWLIEALLRAGEDELAQRQVHHFEKLAGENRRYQIPAARSRAVLRRAEGKPEAVLAELTRASDLSREVGLPGEELLHSLALSEWLQEVGRAQDAERARSGAARVARELAAEMESEQLRSTFVSRWAARGLPLGGG